VTPESSLVRFRLDGAPDTVHRENESRRTAGATIGGFAERIQVAVDYFRRAEGEGEMTMRTLLILAAIIGFSASAFAQTGAPKLGDKPLAHVKPRPAMGCKLVGAVKGTQLWAGDCEAAPELRGATPTPEPEVPAPTPEANPPAAKQ
jgi:hypothetical protein